MLLPGLAILEMSSMHHSYSSSVSGLSSKRRNARAKQWRLRPVILGGEDIARDHARSAQETSFSINTALISCEYSQESSRLERLFGVVLVLRIAFSAAFPLRDDDSRRR